MAVPCRGAQRHHEPAQQETTVGGQPSERGLPAHCRAPPPTCLSLGSLAVTGRHHALTDAQWERIAPLLPSSTGKRGRPWSDHRRVIDAIVHRYRTGIPWRDLPTEFGSWKTVWARQPRWAGEAGGTASSRFCWPRQTQPDDSTGGSQWTPPSTGPSARHEPSKRGLTPTVTARTRNRRTCRDRK
ncbi:transposase [Streptomyces halstedii]|uniref:transposase n=1 Tax=Streptomyces halstedii TaxID=1944 RepID=UPI0036A4D393